MMRLSAEASELIRLHFTPGTTFETVRTQDDLQEFVTRNEAAIVIIALGSPVLLDIAGVRELLVQAVDDSTVHVVVWDADLLRNTADSLLGHPQVHAIPHTTTGDVLLAIHHLQGLRMQLDDQWQSRLMSSVQISYEQAFPRHNDYRSSVAKFTSQASELLPAKRIVLYTLRTAANHYRADYGVPPTESQTVPREAASALTFGPSCRTFLLSESEPLAIALSGPTRGPSTRTLVTSFAVDNIPGFIHFEIDEELQSPPVVAATCTELGREIVHIYRACALRAEFECLRSITEITDLHEGTLPAIGHFLQLLQTHFVADGASWLQIRGRDGDQLEFEKTYVHYGRPARQVRFSENRGFAHYCYSTGNALVISRVDCSSSTCFGTGLAFRVDRLDPTEGKPVKIETFREKHTPEDERSLLYCPVVQGDTVVGVLKLGDFRNHAAFDIQDLRQLRVFAAPISMVLSNVAPVDTLREQLNRVTLPEQLSTYAETLFFYREVALGMFHQVTNHLDEIDSELLLAGTILAGEGEAADLVAKAKLHTSDAKALIKKAERRGERLKPAVRPTELVREVVRPAIDYLRQSAAFSRAENPIRLDHSLTRADYEVNVDPDLMYESLINILNNSVWAIKENRHTVKRQLFIAVRPIERDRVKIEIADSGVGVSPENFNRLFQPFFTTRKNGTGLGLYFARRLVESFSGSIDITRSQPRVGTTVDIVLPLKREVA